MLIFFSGGIKGMWFFIVIPLIILAKIWYVVKRNILMVKLLIIEIIERE